MAVGTTSAFRPTGTVSLNAGTTSANLLLNGGGETVVVTNMTTYLTYVRFGSDETIEASTNDMPVLPSSQVVLSINSLISHAAAFLVDGSGTVLFTRGDGSSL